MVNDDPGFCPVHNCYFEPETMECLGCEGAANERERIIELLNGRVSEIADEWENSESERMKEWYLHQLETIEEIVIPLIGGKDK